MRYKIILSNREEYIFEVDMTLDQFLGEVTQKGAGSFYITADKKHAFAIDNICCLMDITDLTKSKEVKNDNERHNNSRRRRKL
jgi:hypothetical protein